jgi:predicted transposase YdaD
MGRWDIFSKLLIGARPEQYVRWLLPGATLVETLDTALKIQELLTDGLLKVSIDGKPALLHVEFQSYDDPTMGSRMLKYNVLAEHQYKLPVYSIVVYLRKHKVPRTPYIRRFINGRIVHRFHFDIVKLWNIPAERIIALDWEGLLPLLPLSKGGKKPELVQRMVDRLGEIGDKELLQLAELYGGMAFTDENEQASFKRRFFMYQTLMQESWVYQEIIQQGMEKGLDNLRLAVVETIEERFGSTALTEMAQRQVTQMNDPTALRRLIVKIATLQTADEVSALLAQVMPTAPEESQKPHKKKSAK